MRIDSKTTLVLSLLLIPQTSDGIYQINRLSHFFSNTKIKLFQLQVGGSWALTQAMGSILGLAA